MDLMLTLFLAVGVGHMAVKLLTWGGLRTFLLLVAVNVAPSFVLLAIVRSEGGPRDTLAGVVLLGIIPWLVSFWVWSSARAQFSGARLFLGEVVAVLGFLIFGYFFLELSVVVGPPRLLDGLIVSRAQRRIGVGPQTFRSFRSNGVAAAQ